MKRQALLAVALLSVSVVGCDPLWFGRDTGPQTVTIVNTTPDPNLSATPELDSLVLFGAGLAGAASYVLSSNRRRTVKTQLPGAAASGS